MPEWSSALTRDDGAPSQDLPERQSSEESLTYRPPSAHQSTPTPPSSYQALQPDQQQAAQTLTTTHSVDIQEVSEDLSSTPSTSPAPAPESTNSITRTNTPVPLELSPINSVPVELSALPLSPQLPLSGTNIVVVVEPPEPSSSTAQTNQQTVEHSANQNPPREATYPSISVSTHTPNSDADTQAQTQQDSTPESKSVISLALPLTRGRSRSHGQADFVHQSPDSTLLTAAPRSRSHTRHHSLNSDSQHRHSIHDPSEGSNTSGMRRFSAWLGGGKNKDKSHLGAGNTELGARSMVNLPLSQPSPVPSGRVEGLKSRKLRKPVTQISIGDGGEASPSLPTSLHSSRMGTPVMSPAAVEGAAGYFDGNRDSNPGISRTGTPGTPGTPNMSGIYAGHRISESMSQINLPPSMPTYNRPSSPHPEKRKKTLSGIFGKKTKEDELEEIHAWILAYGVGSNLEKYDTKPLLARGKVLDLWDPRGDTVVYLGPMPVPGAPESHEPSFRINSSPLLFATMKQYIVEQELPSQPSPETSDVDSGHTLGHDMFLDIPGFPRGSGLDLSSLAAKMETFDGNAESKPSANNGVMTPAPTASEASGSQRHSVAESASVSQGNWPLLPEAPPAFKLYYPHVPTAVTEHLVHDLLILLLDVRNTFAFLDKRPLVGSTKRKNAYQILESIYKKLFLDTTGITGDNNGGVLTPPSHSPPESPKFPPSRGSRASTPPLFSPNPSRILPVDIGLKLKCAQEQLDHYITVLHLDDVRHTPTSRERRKNCGLHDCFEAIYVGETWQNPRLFLEGFLHSVDNHRVYKSMQEMGNSVLDMLSVQTLQKLELGEQDLFRRLEEIQDRFHGPAGDFAFPDMFEGCGKYKKYASCKTAFNDMRKLFLKHLIYIYGSWPPRPNKSGKSGVTGGETGGMSRTVLQRIERDLGVLWLLMVDTDHPRYPPGGFGDPIGTELVPSTEEDSGEEEEGQGKNIRRILEQFDGSCVIARPRPMFDMPRLPPATIASPSSSDKPKKPKKLKGQDAHRLVESISNSIPAQYAPAANDTATRLLAAFQELEKSKAHGSTPEEIADMRRGHWMFVYAVLQTLPTVTVDAPIARHTEGCEYFLCVGWKGERFPWEDRGERRILPHHHQRNQTRASRRASTMWSSAPGAQAAPAPSAGGYDVLVEGADDNDPVDAAYKRSFCWVYAAQWCKEWADRNSIDLSAVQRVESSPPESVVSSRSTSSASTGARMAHHQHMQQQFGDRSRLSWDLMPQPLQAPPPPPNPAAPAHGYRSATFPTVVMTRQQQRHMSMSGGGVGVEGARTVNAAVDGGVGYSARGGYRAFSGSMGGVGGGGGGGSGGYMADDIPESLLPSTRERRVSRYLPPQSQSQSPQ